MPKADQVATGVNDFADVSLHRKLERFSVAHELEPKNDSLDFVPKFLEPRNTRDDQAGIQARENSGDKADDDGESEFHRLCVG